MTLLFVSAADHAQDWRDALARQLPDLPIRLWPDIGDSADIRYALVWKPPPGLLATLPSLEVIFSLGAGVDALLADPTLPDRPLVRMVEPVMTETMTEFVALSVLRRHRGIEVYAEQQRAGVWRPHGYKPARERTVGVMGLGVLGSDAARALSALRFDVLGWNRSPKEIPGVTSHHGATGLATFLARTEILVCLLPLTAETRHILNRDTFARLPQGAYVINVARGGHLVEADLLEAIDRGHLAGAALDVFETEPLPADHPFWTHPAITITPHIAAITPLEPAAGQVAEGIRRHRQGLPLRNLVDRARGY